MDDKPHHCVESVSFRCRFPIIRLLNPSREPTLPACGLTIPKAKEASKKAEASIPEAGQVERRFFHDVGAEVPECAAEF